MVRITEAGPAWVPLVGCWTKFEQSVSAAAVDQLDVATLAADELARLRGE